MGKALIVVAGAVLAVYAFFDLLATDRAQIRALPKVLWIILVLGVPFVGPASWIMFGTARLRPSAGGPRGPRGPDDDPDFLRDL